MRPEKILIVEDELLVAKNLQLLLEDMGFAQITCAKTGREAVDHKMAEKAEITRDDIYIEAKRKQDVQTQ